MQRPAKCACEYQLRVFVLGPAASLPSACSARWRRSMVTNASGIGTISSVLVFVCAMDQAAPWPHCVAVGLLSEVFTAKGGTVALDNIAITAIVSTAQLKHRT